MKERDKPVIEVNYGLASSYDEFIEVNKKLKHFPGLRDSILAHERRHRNGKYGMKDILNDFQAKKSNFKESLLFSLRNLECLINFFPYMYSYHAKQWTYNSSAMLPFIYFGIIFTLFFKFVFKLPLLHTLLGYLGFVASLNIILLIMTHRYVKKCEKHDKSL